ncbi:MAG: ester cyclase [Candidatus Dormibacteraeota bacterium]|nr:ester cyclase [Candidatus Dormibacteraeota bacterium]
MRRKFDLRNSRGAVAGICLLLLATALAACGNTYGGQPKPSLTADQVANSFFSDVLNKHDVTKMDGLVAPGVVDHDPTPGQAAGIAGFRQRYTALFTAFPDLVATPDDVIYQGEKAAVQNTIQGRQTGPFLGAAATGKTVTLSGVDVFKVVGGKITEHWGVEDDAAIRRQLGLAP